MGTLVPTEAGNHLGLEWAALVRAVVQPILFRHWCPLHYLLLCLSPKLEHQPGQPDDQQLSHWVTSSLYEEMMVSLGYLHQLPHHLVQQLAPLGHRALISLLGHQYSTSSSTNSFSFTISTIL